MHLCIIFIDAEDIQCYIQPICGYLSKSIQRERPQLPEVAHWQPGGSNMNTNTNINTRCILDLSKKGPCPLPPAHFFREPITPLLWSLSFCPAPMQ